MFHHIKELQFNARVSKPDVQFAKLLLEQFGEPNGELKEQAAATDRTEKSVQKENKSLTAKRKEKVDKATTPENGVMSWSVYEDQLKANSKKKKTSK